MEALGNNIKDFKLVPGKGGCFELTVDGQLVYSKRQTGQFPDDEDMVDAVGKLAKA